MGGVADISRTLAVNSQPLPSGRSTFAANTPGLKRAHSLDASAAHVARLTRSPTSVKSAANRANTSSRCSTNKTFRQGSGWGPSHDWKGKPRGSRRPGLLERYADKLRNMVLFLLNARIHAAPLT